MDKYYTKDVIATRCINCVKPYIIEGTQIVEPSAGAGAFLGLRDIAPTLMFDIAPENPAIEKRDFLNFDATTLNSKVAVIGNPPFGRQSSLAKKFIRKSAEFAYLIAFILPKSFKKPSMQKAFPSVYHLVDELELEDDAYTYQGKDYAVPCVFQVWRREKEERKVPPVFVSSLFSFVKKDDGPQITIRRVGFYAGKASTDLNKSIQSHYFIRFNVCVDLSLVCESLNNYIYKDNNTVGPRSLSKGEVHLALLTSINES